MNIEMNFSIDISSNKDCITVPQFFIILLKLALQIISNDKTMRSNTVQALRDFNLKSSATPAKKGEQLVLRCLPIEKL